MLQQYVLNAGIASLLACLACGLGALPLLIPRIDFHNKIPMAYAFAGGLMFSASVFNLIGPAYREVDNHGSVKVVLLLLLGIGLGCLFLHCTERYLAKRSVYFAAPASPYSFQIPPCAASHSSRGRWMIWFKW